MIRCPNCGLNNPIGAEYCESCGASLTPSEIPSNWNRCSGCFVFMLSLPLGLCGAYFAVQSFQPGTYLSGANPIAWAGMLAAAAGLFYGYRLMSDK